MFAKRSMCMCCSKDYTMGYNNAVDDTRDELLKAAELIRGGDSIGAEILLRRLVADSA